MEWIISALIGFVVWRVLRRRNRLAEAEDSEEGSLSRKELRRQRRMRKAEKGIRSNCDEKRRTGEGSGESSPLGRRYWSAPLAAF